MEKNNMKTGDLIEAKRSLWPIFLCVNGSLEVLHGINYVVFLREEKLPDGKKAFLVAAGDRVGHVLDTEFWSVINEIPKR
jgi:hypothetical protein